MDSSKVVKFIRKVVRQEVKKAIRPMINEVLAEQFIRILGQQQPTNNKNTLTSVLGEVDNQQSKSKIDTSTEEKLRKRHEFEKQRLQEKINIISAGDPMAKMIYEDIDDEERIAINSAPTSIPGAYADTDDAGVDLSRFGL